MLENELDRAIDRWLGTSHDVRKALYEHDGPLGNFSRKITLAAALEIVGPASHENFRLIRHVRNAFAHAKVPIRFDTPGVNLFEPPEDVDQASGLSARDRFSTVCNEMMVRLARYSGHDPQFRIRQDSYVRSRRMPSPSRQKQLALKLSCFSIYSACFFAHRFTEPLAK
jgi:hypothetical protein